MQKIIKPWTIYLWKNETTVYAAAPVVTRDGIKEIYRCAWKAQSDELKEIFTAKSYCKKQLRGTMNILNWFGKVALDQKGNIDVSRLNELFATQAYRANNVNKYPEDLWPEIKFPVKEISYIKAKELQLI